jgi:hypothetical protein
LCPEETLDYSLERSMCIPGTMDDMRVEEDCLHQGKQRESSATIGGLDRGAAEVAASSNGMLGNLPEPQSMTNDCTGVLGMDQELVTSLAANTVREAG